MSKTQKFIIAIMSIAVFLVCLGIGIVGGVKLFFTTPTPNTALVIEKQVPITLETSVPTNIPSNDALVNIPAKRAFKHNYKIEEVYDKFKDETVVTLPPKLEVSVSWTIEQIHRAELLVVFAYKGTIPAEPSFVDFAIVSVTKDWRYLSCHDLTLLLDNSTRIPLQTTRQGNVDNGYVSEWISAELPLSTFLQIVNANRVEGKICNDEFKLADEQLEALRDLASRMK